MPFFIDCRESHLRTFCRQIHQCAKIGGWGVKPILQCQDLESACCSKSSRSRHPMWRVGNWTNTTGIKRWKVQCCSGNPWNSSPSRIRCRETRRGRGERHKCFQNSRRGPCKQLSPSDKPHLSTGPCETKPNRGSAIRVGKSAPSSLFQRVWTWIPSFCDRHLQAVALQAKHYRGVQRTNL